MRHLFASFPFLLMVGLTGCSFGVDRFSNAEWRLQIDRKNGGIVYLAHGLSQPAMNWIRERGTWQNRTWVAKSGGSRVTDDAWGLVETNQTGLLRLVQVTQVSTTAWESIYSAPSLSLTVHREIASPGDLAERYTFTNTGAHALEFPLGAVGIHAPLFDQYPDAARSLKARCHVHLWMGGHTAWINAMQMSGTAPHLGLVLTEGSLSSYSQREGTASDRGFFVLHPAAFTLAPGKSYTIAWKIFWHKGWDDFFNHAAESPQFVRVIPSQTVATRGTYYEILAQAKQPLAGASLTVNGKPEPLAVQGNIARARVLAETLGEQTIEISYGKHQTLARVWVTPPIEELLDARLRFIVANQQRIAPGDPLDGAYLAYDNETAQQVYAKKPADHNAGRERIGMGVLAAIYLRDCKDPVFKTKLEESLKRFASFVERELEDDSGIVYGSIGRRDANRLYNFPWVARFHLEMYRSLGDTVHLDRMLRVCRSYYAQGGSKYYAIGLPITGGLAALAAAGRDAERSELLSHFREHADTILANGTNYPPFEVNYEQSIVAPAVQLLLEVYLATHDPRYLEGARTQMPLLEAFCGLQPDHRLNEIAIRHWDDYWFGKLGLYGDTFPHYWSTLNGVTYAYYALATKKTEWWARAETVARGNLSLFAPDGSASCAHLYALKLSGQSAARDDPWANDQDWALVNLLTIQNLKAHQRSVALEASR